MSPSLRSRLAQMSWYHWAGSFSALASMNIVGLGMMGEGYRWFFADDEARMKRFHAKYGYPTERQRLDVFEWMAPKWDTTVSKVEEGGADVYRRDLLARARGDVLEVAMGTGRCFEALEQSGDVKSYVGVDVVQAMLEQAQPKITKLPYEAKTLCADASKLPLPDCSFDTVVATLCLCSLENPEAALNEMSRVCRQDGQVLLVEPGLAERWPVRYAQAYMGLVPNPKHAWEFGWYDDREPLKLVEKSNLKVTSSKTQAMGNWYLIAATPRNGKAIKDQ